MFRIIKTKISRIALFDIITISDIVFGILALVSLLYFFARPIKFADIKVPVATDKASYYAGQPIKGILFGEIYYNGEVRILREVFCADNYHRTIKPPAESAVDGDFFATQSRPHKLDGVTIPIGTLPDDVPLGANCVLQFTNVYDIKTPFGTRHEEYQYYTQNFAIITKERRMQLDCEATGKSTDQCEKELGTDQEQAAAESTLGNDNLVGGGSDNQTNTSETNNTSNTTTNNTTNNNTTTPPPVQLREECTINTLFGLIKVGCRDVAE